eukprot:3503689-Rhodomonas_salina.2
MTTRRTISTTSWYHIGTWQPQPQPQPQSTWREGSRGVFGCVGLRIGVDGSGEEFRCSLRDHVLRRRRQLAPTETGTEGSRDGVAMKMING